MGREDPGKLSVISPEMTSQGMNWSKLPTNERNQSERKRKKRGWKDKIPSIWPL